MQVYIVYLLSVRAVMYVSQCVWVFVYGFVRVCVRVSCMHTPTHSRFHFQTPHAQVLIYSYIHMERTRTHVYVWMRKCACVFKFNHNTNTCGCASASAAQTRHVSHYTQQSVQNSVVKK